MGAEIEWLELDGLQVGLTPRKCPLDPAHVAALAELEGRWPPILVSRHDGRVIDGHHRVAAARLLGRSKVPALLFDGTADDAFVEAVRRNVEHGLPLTIDERKAAAKRLLGVHADWSDRRIAEVCALSPRTVGRLREGSGMGTDGVECRVGRDGRERRVRHETTRLRIIDAVRANPDASLRTIAQVACASPETVRRVRLNIDQPDRTGRASAHDGAPRSADIVALTSVDPAAVVRRPRVADDPALTSTPDGKEFAAWFDRTDLGSRWRSHVVAMPLSRVYEVADEARRRARAWSEFAELVEQRARVHRAV